MKKIIALFLAVIMMFSMTSVSYAANTTVGTETSATTTIDNYMDYLETKLEDSNIFIKLIARLVIIGVMLGIIKVEDFEAWFDNTTPDTDTDTEVDNDKPAVDDNTSTDWEDGAELNLYNKEDLPLYDINKTGASITKIKITKERYNEYKNNYLGRPVKQNYRYKIVLEGTFGYMDDYEILPRLTLQYFSTLDNTIAVTETYYIDNIISSNTEEIELYDYKIDDEKFYCEFYQYHIFEDFDSYYCRPYVY